MVNKTTPLQTQSIIFKKWFFCFFLSVISIVAHGQINMSDDDVFTCGSTYRDPGGTGNYSSNLDIVQTIYPASSNNLVELAFQSFNLHAFDDKLYIYDGTSINASLLGVFNDETNLPPTFRANNVDGALTLRFVTDQFFNASGWEASISCYEVRTPVITALEQEVGYVGMELMIYGENFLGVIQEISFNGTSANTYQVLNDTAISVTVPPNGTTGNITVMNSAGVGTSASVFVYKDVISMSETDVNLCDVFYLDPGGLTNYSNNTSIVQTIHPSPGTVLQLEKYQDDIAPSDHLTIYSGDNIQAPIITGEFIRPLYGDGSLTFEFISNSSVTDAGWAYLLSCYQPGSPILSSLSSYSGFIGDEIIVHGENFIGVIEVALGDFVLTVDDFEILDEESIKINIPVGVSSGVLTVKTVSGTVVSNQPFIVLGVKMSSESLTVCDTTYYDPFGNEDLESGTSMIQTLYPAEAGSVLRVTFLDFAVGGTGNYLKIYDGTSSDDKLIGSYVLGDTIPTITALNPEGALTFVLRSRNTVVGSGWQARVSCYFPDPLAITSFLPDSGYVGTEVEIYGENFYGVSEVTFNGHPASAIEVVSNRLIKASIPVDDQNYSGPIYVKAMQGETSSMSSFYQLEGLVMSNTNITLCDTIYLDPGGAGNYPVGMEFIQTIYPALPGHMIKIEYLEDTEGRPFIYNGTSQFSDRIDNSYQDVFLADNPDGALTFKFSPNQFVSPQSGWLARISCYEVKEPDVDYFTPEYGYAGREVRIYGASFSRVNAVSFNGVPASSFEVFNTNYQYTDYIKAVAPVGATTGPITVTNITGIDTSDTDFHYFDLVNMSENDITLCDAIYFDPAGTAEYTDDGDLVQTLYPSDPDFMLKAQFQLIDIGPQGYLNVYDGTSIHAPLIKTFDSGSYLRTLIANNADGALTFELHSGWGNNDWEVVLTCIPEQDPVITDIHPNTGYPGKRVTIKGDGVVGTQEVLFNGVPAYEFTVYEDEIVAASPLAGNATGQITITNFRGSSTSNEEFVHQEALILNSTDAYITDTVFFDPSGESDYRNNVDITQTIYPQEVGKKVKLDFEHFALQYNDTDSLKVFNGTSTDAPVLLALRGRYADLSRLQAVADNPEGALTFRFFTTNEDVDEGWKGRLSSYIPATPSITSIEPDSGFAGSEMFIYGDDFYSITEVSFNGVPATFEVLNLTTIKAVSPVNSSTGKITVTNAWGTATSDQDYTYVEGIIMHHGDIYACQQHFFDPGGLGEFQGAHGTVQTIYPDVENHMISLKFLHASIQGGDKLLVYNGTSVNDPLIATLEHNKTGTQLFADNPDGALTLKLTTKSYVGSSDWEALIDCYHVGVPIVSDFELSMNEDEVYDFYWEFNDYIRGLDVEGIIITSLPDNGVLEDYRGNPIAVGEFITLYNVYFDLYFKPDANWNGTTSFTYKARNEDGDSEHSATVTFIVHPVDDPTGIESIPDITLCVNEIHEIDLDDYLFDVDGDDISIDDYSIELTERVISGNVSTNDISINYNSSTHIVSLEHKSHEEAVFEVDLMLTNENENLSSSFQVVSRHEPQNITLTVEDRIATNGTNYQVDVLQAPSGTAYQWFKDGIAIAEGGESKFYTVLDIGDYHVEFTSSRGCPIVSDNIKLDIVTMINFLDISSSMQAFPNPSDGMMSLKIENGLTGQFKIRVINLLGKTMLDQVISKKINRLEIPLDLSKLTKGMYLLEVTHENSRGIIRVVKQ